MNCSSKEESGYEPLTDDEAENLRVFLSEVGAVRAARYYGLSRQTLTAAAAGCSIQSGTRLIIRTKKGMR